MLFDAIDLNRPFVLIEKDGRVACYQGALHEIQDLNDIHQLARTSKRDVTFALPYHAIQERGFEAHGNEPILAMEIETSLSLPKETLIKELPDSPINLEGEITPSQTDQEYADLVRDFQTNEIEHGNASQTTLARSFSGQIKAFDVETALTIFRRALQQRGQYMTVLFANIDPDDK